MARVPASDGPSIDPFRGKHSTGLRDDFDATVLEVLFTYDSQYNNGASLVARITLRDDTADPENIEKFGEEEVLLLSTGNGWEDDAKGRKAKREDGKAPDAFQDTCNYMVFLNAALDCGAEEIIRGRGVMPWEAELLEGLSFHMNRVQYTPWNWNEKTDEEKAKGLPSRLLPTAFLGEGGEGGGEAEPEPKAATKAAPKAVAKESAPASDGLGAAMRVKFKKVAKESDTHDEFMERVFSEIDGSDAFEDIVADDSDEGFYAQNHDG